MKEEQPGEFAHIEHLVENIKDKIPYYQVFTMKGIIKKYLEYSEKMTQEKGNTMETLIVQSHLQGFIQHLLEGGSKKAADDK